MFLHCIFPDVLQVKTKYRLVVEIFFPFRIICAPDGKSIFNVGVFVSNPNIFPMVNNVDPDSVLSASCAGCLRDKRPGNMNKNLPRPIARFGLASQFLVILMSLPEHFCNMFPGVSLFDEMELMATGSEESGSPCGSFGFGFCALAFLPANDFVPVVVAFLCVLMETAILLFDLASDFDAFAMLNQFPLCLLILLFTMLYRIIFNGDLMQMRAQAMMHNYKFLYSYEV